MRTSPRSHTALAARETFAAKERQRRRVLECIYGGRGASNVNWLRADDVLQELADCQSPLPELQALLDMERCDWTRAMGYVLFDSGVKAWTQAPADDRWSALWLAIARWKQARGVNSDTKGHAAAAAVLETHREWLQERAEADPYAQMFLGKLVLLGALPSLSEKAGIRALMFACRGVVAGAAFLLFRANKRVVYLDFAAVQKYPPALLVQPRQREEGVAPMKLKDAFFRYERAAMQGFVPAVMVAAFVLNHSASSNDARHGNEHSNSAVALGNAQALLDSGRYLISQFQYKDGFELLRAAADAGHAEACRSMAFYLRDHDSHLLRMCVPRAEQQVCSLSCCALALCLAARTETAVRVVSQRVVNCVQR